MLKFSNAYCWKTVCVWFWIPSVLNSEDWMSILPGCSSSLHHYITTYDKQSLKALSMLGLAGSYLHGVTGSLWKSGSPCDQRWVTIPPPHRWERHWPMTNHGLTSAPVDVKTWVTKFWWNRVANTITPSGESIAGCTWRWQEPWERILWMCTVSDILQACLLSRWFPQRARLRNQESSLRKWCKHQHLREWRQQDWAEGEVEWWQ